MEKLYSKIVIIKIDILMNPDDPNHHQTTIHVQKEMTEEAYKEMIEQTNIMYKIKQLLMDELAKKVK